MRADTHDGPEQMLHVRGLIHCCSSHVRRSWNSVLQRAAGPYTSTTANRAVPLGFPLAALKRTWSGSTRRTGFDPLQTLLMDAGCALVNSISWDTLLADGIECHSIVEYDTVLSGECKKISSHNSSIEEVEH